MIKQIRISKWMMNHGHKILFLQFQNQQNINKVSAAKATSGFEREIERIL